MSGERTGVGQTRDMKNSSKIDKRQTVVVVGNGMVGHRFCEKLIESDKAGKYRVVTFCEEARAAYDRVGLTQFFAHRDAEKLMLANQDWYRENGIELHVGDCVENIDRRRKVVRSRKGEEITYDIVVAATGSYPFVPPVPGIGKTGVFVYRTIEDLEQIISYAGKSRVAAVIGGGLLGLEAAKAAYDLGMQTHVVEFAPRLMPRQIDALGSEVLVNELEKLGVQVHLAKGTKEVVGDSRVAGILFEDGEGLDCEMIIVSAGIRPRDELARECGLDVGERGGVVVDDQLRTSDPDIYAIGEVALHQGMVYGLVAPGYEMAEVVAANLVMDGEGVPRSFTGADLSAKLKLMGIDVACFGDHEAGPDEALPVVHHDPFSGVYRKLLFDHEGQRLLGGVLVGDASDYGALSVQCRGGQPLAVEPGVLVAGSRAGKASGAAVGITDMPDDAQICSCNGVTRGTICNAIREQELSTVGEIKSLTRAGSGCGGCVPLVTELLAAEMAAAGKQVSTDICEHFRYTRQELYAICKTKGIRSFTALVADYGSGEGCEICKPVVASIIASLWNEHILDHAALQDSNDRFLANIQKNGLYSIVPRVPGGEITPEKLIALGSVAKKYGLYTKITGGQRIDLFGAPVHQLPDIWEELIDAGFESGHAYGKALRTVKSCVGTSWCRYGVRDSVGFAVSIEKRYRGLRAPHKIKSAVSGCVRECAEAQGKDFGLIATEQGYSLYVCGNGGSNPRHADLLATDLDEETCIRYIDRFLMYYIQTADKLTRTSVWLEKLEGGIEALRAVVIDDKLGIGDELEQQMQSLVDGYECEWKRVVEDPDKRKMFKQFVNSPNGLTAEAGEKAGPESVTKTDGWVRVGTVGDFPDGAGACIEHGGEQIAVFNFSKKEGHWYATQNTCPHTNAPVLARGIIGDAAGEPKVACPLHKKNFSLKSGQCLGEESPGLRTFPVKIESGEVFVSLSGGKYRGSKGCSAVNRAVSVAGDLDSDVPPAILNSPPVLAGGRGDTRHVEHGEHTGPHHSRREAGR